MAQKTIACIAVTVGYAIIGISSAKVCNTIVTFYKIRCKTTLAVEIVFVTVAEHPATVVTV